MSDSVRFLKSIRARLILLLSGFLLLTMFLVVALDSWARSQGRASLTRQQEEVKHAVDEGLGDFAQAIGAAIQSLDSKEFLYDQIEAKKLRLPRSVEHIIVTDKDGVVKDTTLRDVNVDSRITVPQDERTQEHPGDPVVGELELHGDEANTYNIPLTTAKGLYWIVVVTKSKWVTNKIDDASLMLASKSRQLSNIRLIATSALLVAGLALAVISGWSFTRPIKELAAATRRVAAGELDFRVEAHRQDEVGQLAATFNEMIVGLKAKRELEEKLNQSERSAVIGRLTQAVAHEIRNPLNVINLSIDHVATKYGPGDEKARQQVTRILSSIKDEIGRLKRLVNDLLNYGRPPRLAVEPVDIGQLVHETLDLIRPQADEQHVDIGIEEAQFPIQVQGDRERLKSCVSNLAINALQAMPKGGRLSASIARNNGIVEIAISDTGVGIGEEALGKIFEPYFSTKQAGFGLGLAVTKAIVQEHKGDIEVRSAPDLGTTFIMKLPAAADDPLTSSRQGDGSRAPTETQDPRSE